MKKADEVNKQEGREEGKRRPDKPYVLIQNNQLLSGEPTKTRLKKGAIYTVEELEKVLKRRKKRPFKIRYRLFDKLNNGSDYESKDDEDDFAFL